MPAIDTVVSSPVSQSMRCRQVEALFDVPPQEKQTLRWSGDVPLDARPWNVGLIVGPSGSGKSTVARALFGAEALRATLEWSGGSVLDDFPEASPLADISAICQAVGFNTIPAWLRPFSVLSNGEQFRVMLARKLIESPALVVLDEFTSVVDRQVARIGSHAVQKHVRKRGTHTGGVSVAISATVAGTIGELLAAADLMARGFMVFFPLTRTGMCDLIALGKDGHCERIEVRCGHRSGNRVVWQQADRSKSDRRAIVLTGESVHYEPGFEGP